VPVISSLAAIVIHCVAFFSFQAARVVEFVNTLNIAFNSCTPRVFVPLIC